MAKAEKFILENFCLKDMFKEDFIRKLDSIHGDVFPVTVVFINETEEEGVKNGFPIIFNHQSKEEVDKKLLHVESSNTELIERVVKILEEKDG